MKKIDENTPWADLTDEDITTIPEDLLCEIMQRNDLNKNGMVVMDGETDEETMRKWQRKSEVKQ